MYVKLFPTMYDGTLVTKGPWQALVTFQQMLILCDERGEVDMTAGAISNRTTIPLDIIQTGIKALEQPDPESRNPELEGRRIVRLADHRSWGWRIVNYEHYRAIRDKEARREYQNEWQNNKRRQQKSTPVNESRLTTANGAMTTNDDKDDPRRSRSRSNSSKAITPSSELAAPTADPAPPESKKRGNGADAIAVLDFLNAQTGRAFRPTDATLRPIKARLAEGYSVVDLKAVVIRRKTAWWDDDRMRPYLRPDTLFNATKFAQYVGEVPPDKPKEQT